MEYLPARQLVHMAFPMTSLYFPATQPVHVPPTGPEKPVLQRQEVCAGLEAGENEFNAQVRHTLDSVAAGVVEYLPARQLVHMAFWPRNTYDNNNVEKIRICESATSTYLKCMLLLNKHS